MTETAQPPEPAATSAATLYDRIDKALTKITDQMPYKIYFKPDTENRRFAPIKIGIDPMRNDINITEKGLEQQIVGGTMVLDDDGAHTPLIVLHPTQLAALAGNNVSLSQHLIPAKIENLSWQAHVAAQHTIDPQTGLPITKASAEKPHLLLSVSLPDGSLKIIPAYIADFADPDTRPTNWNDIAISQAFLDIIRPPTDTPPLDGEAPSAPLSITITDFIIPLSPPPASHYTGR